MPTKDFHFNSKPKAFGKAKTLRERQTEAEHIMWEQLRNRSFQKLKFRRQHPIAGFIVDFYCHELLLAVEIDGGVHDNSEQIEYDKGRTNVISEFEIDIIRFRNDEVLNKLGKVLKELEWRCNERRDLKES